MHGVYGTLDAGVEVQRTINRDELTASLCLSLGKPSVPPRSMLRDH